MLLRRHRERPVVNQSQEPKQKPKQKAEEKPRKAKASGK